MLQGMIGLNRGESADPDLLGPFAAVNVAASQTDAQTVSIAGLGGGASNKFWPILRDTWITAIALTADTQASNTGTATFQIWLAPRVGINMALTSVANATNIVTATGHGLVTGDGPFRLTTSGGLPVGLALATDYYISRIDANTFYLCATLADAYAGVAVDFSTDGTGTHTLSAGAGSVLAVDTGTTFDLVYDPALSVEQGFTVRYTAPLFVPAGRRLQIRITTSADWSATGADLTIFLEAFERLGLN